MTRYMLVRDEAAHWYVCPVDRYREVENLFLNVPYDQWPNWIHRVGGSHTRVTFADPEIGGKKVE